MVKMKRGKEKERRLNYLSGKDIFENRARWNLRGSLTSHVERAFLRSRPHYFANHGRKVLLVFVLIDEERDK